MNKYHRLGIKNFKSIRHPGQIKIVFDLCSNDLTASRYVSSKVDEYNKKTRLSDDDKLQVDCFPERQSTNRWLQESQRFKILANFIMNILDVIFRVLFVILKYTLCLIWCLCKILLHTIFRLVVQPQLYQPKAFIYHPIRCHHYQR